jgi:tetratricopeptide (TPR) repeat protein
MLIRIALIVILSVNHLISTPQDKNSVLESIKHQSFYNPDSAMIIVNMYDSLNMFNTETEQDAMFRIYKSKLYKHNKKYAEAQQELFYAANIFKKLNNTEQIYKTNFRLGELYKSIGITDKAKKYYYKAYNIAKESNIYDAWDCYFNMIYLNISDREFDIALSNLDSAVFELEKRDTINMIASEVLNIKGIIFLKINDYETSLKVLDSAMHMNITDNDSISLAINYTNIGRVHFAKRDYYSAYKYYKKAYEIDSIRNNINGLFTKGFNLASAHIRLGNSIEARRIYYNLLNTPGVEKNYKHMSRLHHNIAILHYSMDNPQLTDKHIDLSIEYTKKIGDQEYLAELYYLKSKNDFYFNNRKDSAYELLKESYLISNKLYSEDIARTIKNYELKSNIVEQETRLNSNNKNLESQVNKLQLQLTIAIIILTIALIIIVITYILFRKRVKGNITIFKRYQNIFRLQRVRYNQVNSTIDSLKRDKETLAEVAEHTKNDMNKLIMLVEESDKITQECIKIVNKDISKSDIEKLTDNLKRLESIISGNDMIKYHLDNEYAEFRVKLNDHFSNLTKGEELLCTLIRYNYSTSQIASYTNTSQKTIEVSRYRLRKKLGFDNNNDFYNTLNNL